MEIPASESEEFPKSHPSMGTSVDFRLDGPGADLHFTSVKQAVVTPDAPRRYCLDAV